MDEGLRLQGTTHQRWVQVGNAVPPALAEAAGRLVLAAHRARLALQAAGLDEIELALPLRRGRLSVPGGGAA